MKIAAQIKVLFNRLHQLVTSARGKEVLLFLLFLLISYIFWLLLTLNNEMQEDLDVPVAITDVPDSVTLISELPPAVKVSVRDKGSVLLRYKWGSSKVMKINWKDYTETNNKLLLNKADLAARLRDYFGGGSQIVTIIPDSIRINYTTSPGRRVVVRVNADIHPAMGYIVNGPIRSNVDSVWLYSVNDLPHSLTSVETVPVVRGGLNDTTYIEARIDPIPGVRIIPDHVRLAIPVEPLIARKQKAPIVVKNLSESMSMITFPSSVEVSYLVPMSSYNSEPYEVNAYVDYNDLSRCTGGKLPVTLSLLPDLYHNTEMSPDSVEYIVEHKH